MTDSGPQQIHPHSLSVLPKPETPTEHEKQIRSQTFVSTCSPSGEQQITLRIHEFSTASCPRIAVEITDKGEKKTCVVEVDKVNPRCATRVEMYALVAYREGGHTDRVAASKALRPIELAASPRNPLYVSDPSASYWEERMDFPALLEGLRLPQADLKDTGVTQSVLSYLLEILTEYPRAGTPEPLRPLGNGASKGWVF